MVFQNGVRSSTSRTTTIATVVCAGLVGGMAEVVWIGLYTLFTPLSADSVLREVVASVAPASAGVSFVSALGMAIHLGLSVALAAIFGLLVWKPLSNRLGFDSVVIAASAALISVWAINFFVVLPQINPAFVTLMPYSVTFISKLLFGLSMGWFLYRFGGRPVLGRAAIRDLSLQH